MSTQEISRGDWTIFFDTFSREHEGLLATLELFDPDVGAQELVNQLPFEGVSVSEAGDLEDIALNFGGPSDDAISHVVSGVTHVWLEKTAEGANAALEIESADKSKTLLRFRSPVEPGLVDGVVSP
ncbi:MAG TPA: DUF5335 family protein [Pyrinomonadaceae bacterium]